MTLTGRGRYINMLGPLS